MKHFDVFVVGAGVAGISAARTAAEQGKSVLLCDREAGFGGVLRQCSHRGFGNGLTGPEYIDELTLNFPEHVELCFSCTVLEIRKNKSALLTSRERGLFEVSFSRLILATGCMEISPGMLPLGGTRPQGVYTAGEAQLMNFCGESFPSPVVILGSGDLGLIMAKQLRDQGQQISCIIEIKEKPSAMARNRGILELVPLRLNTTVSRIHGERHLEGVSLLCLDSGQEEYLPCATLLIAAGLRPDRSLVHGLEDEPWIEYCGNCLKIYPMVEGLAADAESTARAVCERI